MIWMQGAECPSDFIVADSYTVHRLYRIPHAIFHVYTPPIFMSLGKVLFNPIAVKMQGTTDLR